MDIMAKHPVSTHSSPASIVIEPSRFEKEYIKDLIRYHELFYFFAWRDILIRYRQTTLGIAWAIFRPLLNMAVFALVFGKFAGLASQQAHYPLFVLAGLLPWQFLSSCLVDSSSCLANHATMISKIYFPRLILPASHILVNMIDFLIGLVLLLVCVPFFTGRWGALWFLPVCLLSTLSLVAGASFWTAALSARFRDLRFLVPFFLQFGLFLSPIGYSSFFVQSPWRWIYFLNPLAGLVEGYRFVFLGGQPEEWWIAFGLSFAISVFMSFSGFCFFRRMEVLFADIL